LRVLLTSANFRPHVGGIERFAEMLARGLAGRGHAVTVLACRYEGAPVRELGDGYDIVRVPSSYAAETRLGVPYPLPSPALLRTLRELIREVDVVHVQDALYATSVATLLTAHRHRVPSVLTVHVGFVPQRSATLDAAQRLAIATLGRAARLASAVATYNPAISEWVARAWGIDEPRVMPAGVEAPTATATRSETRHSFGLDEERFIALFVGRDVAKKALDIFLSAGDPSYDLVAVTDRPGTVPGATLLPFMPVDRLHDLLQAVDAFALPSEGEGFPLVLQEAFAYGLPVVTTMQPGYDHYLDDGDVIEIQRDAGSLREALVRLAGSPDLREHLSRRSLAVAGRSFGLDRFVAAYEELYTEVVRATGSG
jgi:phosphatidylinositol alpha-mannosyltransferase/phosphatidylinositol alpha-1,6-mannosyltransferase